jgi:hypothetical protein
MLTKFYSRKKQTDQRPVFSLTGINTRDTGRCLARVRHEIESLRIVASLLSDELPRTVARHENGMRVLR